MTALAEAYIKVSPDMDAFAASMRSQFAKIARDNKFFLTVGVKLDDTQVKSALDKLSKKTVNVKAKLNLDDSQARATLNKLGAKTFTVKARVKVDDNQAESVIDRIKAKLATIKDKTVKVDVKQSVSGVAGSVLGVGGVKDAAGATALQKAMIGLNIATGIAEPALAAVAVTVAAVAAGAVAAGIGLGGFATVAKTQFAAITQAMKDQQAVQAATSAAQVKLQSDQAAAAAGDSAAQKRLAADHLAVKASLDGTSASAIKLKTDIAALTPTQKELLTATTGVKDEFNKWTSSLAPEVMKPIIAAMSLVNPLLKDMAPFVREAASAAGDLEQKLSGAVHSSGFQEWLKTMLPLVKPTIVGIGTAIGDVVVGIGGVLKAFAPFEGTVIGGLDKMTKKFETWGTTLSKHSGFQSLLGEWKQNWPQVKVALGDFAAILKNVLSDVTGLATGANSKALWDIANPVLGMLREASTHPELVRILLYLLAVKDASSKIGGVFGSISKAVDGMKDAKAFLGRLLTGQNPFVSGQTAAEKISLAFAEGGKIAAAEIRAAMSGGVVPAGTSAAGGAAAFSKAGIAATAVSVLGAAAIAVAVTAIAGVIIGHFLPEATPAEKKRYQTQTPGPVKGFLQVTTGGNAEKISGALQRSRLGKMAGPDTEIPNWWSAAYEHFQRDFAGKITHWFTVSLPDAFTKGISNRLWSPSYEHFQRDFAGKVTSWVTESLPHAFTHSIPGWFDGAFGHFQSAVIAPVRGFVTATLPGFFTQTIPHWFDKAVSSFTGDVISPVKSFVLATLPGFFTSTIPHWFSKAVASFTGGVISPVKVFVLTTLPGYFSSTIPKWFSKAVSAFTSGVISPVRTFIMTTLPGFFTKTIPHWFDKFGAAFSTVKDTVSGFFTKTVPGVVISGFKSGLNSIIDLINGVIGKIPGGIVPKIPHVAGGGIIGGRKAGAGAAGGGVLSGYSPGVDSQWAKVSPGEGILVPEAVRAIGPETVHALNRQYGKGRKSTGNVDQGYAGGGIHIPHPHIPNPLNILKDIARMVPGALRSGFDAIWDHTAGPVVKAVAGGGIAGKMAAVGAESIKTGIDNALGANDASASGAIGSGSGSQVASYAASYGTGKGHPYVTGGSTPNGWDCSGFSAWVYEHFGYFPEKQGTRHGTSESQSSDPLLQRASPQPGALVFFNDGVYANPGHVGVMLNNSAYVGADSPAVGTVVGSAKGGYDISIPKGGFITSTPGHGGIPANAAAISSYLRAHGANKVASAGILGNIEQESGGNPDAGSNPPGKGLIQILGDPGGSLSADLPRTLAYINRNGGFGPVNKAGNAASAATIFMKQYERPAAATANLAGRIASANASFAAGYAGGGVVPGLNKELSRLGRIQPNLPGAISREKKDLAGLADEIRHLQASKKGKHGHALKAIDKQIAAIRVQEAAERKALHDVRHAESIWKTMVRGFRTKVRTDEKNQIASIKKDIAAGKAKGASAATLAKMKATAKSGLRTLEQEEGIYTRADKLLGLSSAGPQNKSTDKAVASFLKWQPPKPKPAPAGSGGDPSGGGGGGGGGGSTTTPPVGVWVGPLPGAPGAESSTGGLGATDAGSLMSVQGTSFGGWLPASTAKANAASRAWSDQNFLMTQNAQTNQGAAQSNQDVLTMLRRIAQASERAPSATAGGLGQALNGVSRGAVGRALYSTGSRY